MWPFLKKHVQWFLTRIDRDRVDSASAHGAFFLIISFLPFLAFLLTLMQMIHFSSGLTMIEAALELLPPAISTALSALIPSPLVASGVLPVAVPPVSTVDRVVEMVPDVLDRVEKFFDKKEDKDLE